MSASTEQPAPASQEKRWLTLQTIVILVGLAGSTLGGAKWVVSSSWAQAKEHADAGIAVLRAEFDAHKADESSERERTRSDIKAAQQETREMRQELRMLYDYQRNGRDQPALSHPLPPLDGGR